MFENHLKNICLLYTSYQLGADDYIIKPFQLSLLHAKVIAMIKRDQKKEENILTVGHLQLDRCV